MIIPYFDDYVSIFINSWRLASTLEETSDVRFMVVIPLHGSYRKASQLSQRSFVPLNFSCTACNWSIENGSYYSMLPPTGLQPLWGIRKIYILWWTAHSNLLHNKEVHPLDKTESLQRFSRNRHIQSIQDENSFPWLLNSSFISFLSNFLQRYLRWTFITWC